MTHRIIFIDFIYNSLESIKNNEKNELAVYIFYVYYLIFLAIFFEPTINTSIIIFLFVIICCINIFNEKNCKKINNYIKIIGIIVYAFFCIIMHRLIHFIYWKMKNMQFILLFMPFFYFSVVKFMLFLFGCNKFANFNYMIDIVKYIVNIFNK
jgi:hypothetical protein